MNGWWCTFYNGKKLAKTQFNILPLVDETNWEGNAKNENEVYLIFSARINIKSMIYFSENHIFAKILTLSIVVEGKIHPQSQLHWLCANFLVVSSMLFWLLSSLNFMFGCLLLASCNGRSHDGINASHVFLQIWGFFFCSLAIKLFSGRCLYGLWVFCFSQVFLNATLKIFWCCLAGS